MFARSPYSTGIIAFRLAEVILAARSDCYFHTWLVDLICSNMDDLFDKTNLLHSDTIEFTVQLNSIYASTLVPNERLQHAKFRTEWSVHKIMEREWERAEIQHRHQVANSPYSATVVVRLVHDNKTISSKTENLSFWKAPVTSTGRSLPRICVNLH
jgi:hypothetical protein